MLRRTKGDRHSTASPRTVRLQSWQPKGQVRALLLATQASDALGELLVDSGISLRALADDAGVSASDFAQVARELRREAPELPLLTLGPAAFLKHFATEYPPFSDAELALAPPDQILENAERALSNLGLKRMTGEAGQSK